MIACPKEHDEQKALFRWADLAKNRYPALGLMYAIPNGGHRNIITARKLKAEGVKAGVPDIHLPVAKGGFHGLYLELKRQRGGQVSVNLGEWILALRHEGYKVEVCHGFDEARRAIEEYLK